MDYDIVIFGFNEFGLFLVYELSKYNLKIALIDERKNYSKNYLSKDSIIVYNGVSNFNNNECLDKSCYEAVKKLCEDYCIKNEEIDFKFKVGEKEYYSKKSLLLNFNNVTDVFYRISIKNSVDFIFDKKFKEFVKEENKFYINGTDLKLTCKEVVDTRNFKNYKYTLETYTLSLNFEDYFKNICGFTRDGYYIIFYKNFNNNIKVDIVHEMDFNICYISAIKEYIKDFNSDNVIIKQIEYLRYNLFDKSTLHDFVLNKNHLGFNSIFYGVNEIIENLKSKFEFVLKDENNKTNGNNENINDNDFNNLLCYCNLLSEAEIMDILNKHKIYTVEQLLSKINHRFNNCIDCYDKFYSIIVKHNSRVLNKSSEDNTVKVKNFNEI